ncbi:hypothetical protein L6452_35856 [Arctium lappa]|uniref:Uncharacterized protein n=1 Tax=Arctium lappa TaxID=4217 RepID=A0ACB8Y878_ARCLA|nr:hypothetical protein L6452_35856 [Arctium lappa]
MIQNERLRYVASLIWSLVCTLFEIFDTCFLVFKLLKLNGVWIINNRMLYMWVGVFIIRVDPEARPVKIFLRLFSV